MHKHVKANRTFPSLTPFDRATYPGRSCFCCPVNEIDASRSGIEKRLNVADNRVTPRGQTHKVQPIPVSNTT